MTALGDVQAAMRSALLGGDDSTAAELVESDGMCAGARLAIYRHHVFTTLTAVLEAVYPVVCRLVDRRFFAYAADSYIRAEPPAGPCLFEYGAGFADFLERLPACRHLAYLPDVARLEWAMHRALHAPDAEPMDAAQLAGVTPGDVARLVVALDPSISHLRSPWPIDRIWRANQEDARADRVDLAAGGTDLEIGRAGGTVTMRQLAPADHALRSALGAGATLGEAARAARDRDPAFDLARALGDLLDERILIGFTVSKG